MARKTIAGGRGAGAKKARKGARKSAARSAQVRARIDPAVKEKAETILEDLGLNPSSAISTFYRQIVLRRGLPFPVEMPNATTIEAIEEARLGADLIEGEDLQELLAKLLSKKDRSVELSELVEAHPGALRALLLDA